jgi:hypothetical protein
MSVLILKKAAFPARRIMMDGKCLVEWLPSSYKGAGKMILPILPKLKDGEKFDFDTLADNDEETERFWEWWWEGRRQDLISRPEIIHDEDPILIETVEKQSVDLISRSPFFNEWLTSTLQQRLLTAGYHVPRETFRTELCKLICNHRSASLEEPVIVFAGGGYGSGKTTVLNFMCERNALPLKGIHIVGVDIFKLLVPEFSLITAVSDGRASLTVQKECKGLANEAFSALVEQKKSFIWDSSLSDRDDAISRIQAAKSAGYKTHRRFPHPTFLPLSHKGFRENLIPLSGFFDEAIVFAKDDSGADTPSVIAEKRGGEKELVIHSESRFSSLLQETI